MPQRRAAFGVIETVIVLIVLDLSCGLLDRAPPATQTRAPMFIECVLLASSLCQTVRDKPVMALFAVGTGAAVADVWQTERARRVYAQPCSFTPSGPCGFHEYDPLVRPLLPHPAAYYAVAIGYSALPAWLGHRLRISHSRLLRSLWWMPQVAAISGSAGGLAFSFSRHPG